MRLFLSWFVLVVTVFTVFVNAEDDATVPEISVTASFPENNPFGQVVNGERNRIDLLIENNSDLNITLISVTGSFHDARTDILLKNATTLPYGLRLISGTKLQVPYQFHSEFKPGDIRLNVWLTHSVNDKVYQVTAYDSMVTVVEPEISLFDYQLITTYLLTAAFLGGLGYFAFVTFVPKPKKSRKTANSSKSAIGSTAGSVSATGAGGYEEEWIPEHHLKVRNAKKKAGVVSSGDEQSAGEASGTEGKRHKRRK